MKVTPLLRLNTKIGLHGKIINTPKLNSVNASSVQLTCVFLIRITKSMFKFSMKSDCRTICVLFLIITIYHYRDQAGMTPTTRGLRLVLSDAEMKPNQTIGIHKFNIIGDQMIIMRAVISSILN
jgi:hypothetical protein